MVIWNMNDEIEKIKKIIRSVKIGERTEEELIRCNCKLCRRALTLMRKEEGSL